MAERTFGCPPIILSLPYQEKLRTSSPAGFEMIIAGCNSRIAEAFVQHKNFWLNTAPPQNLEIDGFALHPEEMAPDQSRHFERISPTTLIHDGGEVQSTSDDWPFLYLRGRLIPDLTIRSMVILGLVGLGMVYLFLPKRRIAINGRMFFLGAAFMLLETRAVVQMALLFGSTWLVNSAVFFAVLILILLANLYVLKVQRVLLFWHYVGLLIFLTAGVFIPVDVFLNGGIRWRYAAPCILALGPMLFCRGHLCRIVPRGVKSGSGLWLQHCRLGVGRLGRVVFDAAGVPALIIVSHALFICFQLGRHGCSRHAPDFAWLRTGTPLIATIRSLPSRIDVRSNSELIEPRSPHAGAGPRLDRA